jgi:hypothetical protein
MERIIKLEHIAEALVSDFFEVFMSEPNCIQAFDENGDPIKVTTKHITDLFEQTPTVKSQLQVNEYFHFSDIWKKQFGLTSTQDVEIDNITCFDCALVVENKTILPIEVKSGSSDRYKDTNNILKYSFFEKELSVTKSLNKTYLKGDMISLLTCPIIMPKEKDLSKLDFNTNRVIIPKKDSTTQLHNNWILVVKTNDHLKGFKANSKNRIKFIFTIQNIIPFLEEAGKIPRKFENPSKKTEFENRISKDIDKCLEFAYPKL